MNAEYTPQELIAEAMGTLSAAEPPQGMQPRIVVRVREAHAAQAVWCAPRWRLPLFASTALVAAAALCVFLIHPAAKVPISHPQPGLLQNTADLRAFTPPMREPRQRTPPTVPVHLLHRKGIAAEPQSFPAPPSPLTEQELLLLRAVQQNQPETMKALGLIASNNDSERMSMQSGDHE